MQTTRLPAVFAMLVLSCGDAAVEPPLPPRAPVPATVTVSPASATLTALEETARFTAEVRDQNGQVMAGATVAWASSDASVAAVDASGLVTAAANGSATIAATVGSVSGTAGVTVAQAVSAVVVSPTTATIAFGDTFQLTAEAFDGNGYQVDGAAFDWMSSDTSVASVSPVGLVSTEGAGTATITATADGVSGGATLAVAQRIARISADLPFLTLGEAGKQGRERIHVTVMDTEGIPVADASYRWTTDRHSGWVFPAEGKSSGSGLISATWVAGWPGNGLLRLAVENLVSSLTVEIPTRSSAPPNPPSGALYLNTYHEGTSAGYSIDITPLTEPAGTFYAAIQWDGGYAGLQRAGDRYDRQLQFSVWNAPGFGDAQVVDFGPGVACRPFGGEGTGQACELEYPWRVGSTYRFEVTEQEMAGGSAMTLHVTDIASDERRYVGTLRFARRARMRSSHMFVEDFWHAEDHCLAREVRSAAVRRTMALIDGEWQAMTVGFLGKASADAANPGTPGCANVAGRSHPNGLEIVIGGDAVSDPNGPIRVTIPN